MADPKQQQDINQLSTQDKLGEALNRALPLLPKEVRERVQELASPESVSAIATIGAVYVASHAVGIGELGDAAVLGVGAVALGSEAVNVAKDLSSFVQVATQAKNEADLDRAAEHLASAVSKVSVDTVAAVLAHKAGKVVEEKLPRSVESEVVNKSQMRTLSAPERPPLSKESGQTPINNKEVAAQLGSYLDDPALSTYPRSYEEFEALAKDPAKNSGIDDKSKIERMVVLEQENRGLLKEVVRDNRKLPEGVPSGDFIEDKGAGQVWDVKGFNSSFAGKKGSYKLEEALEAIEGEFNNGESVIIDTSKMYPEHIAELHQAVVERGWSERVLWDDPQLSRGKTIESEISQSKQTKLPAVASTLLITSAAAAQQTQPTEAQETPQPQRVEANLSAKIIASGQADPLEPEKADNQPQADPALSAAQNYEKLIATTGEYDAHYHVTRFKDGDYTARLENDTKVLSVESSDGRGVLFTYDQDTQELTTYHPLEEKDIQHFEEVQTKLDTSKQEAPKVESRVQPQPVQPTGQAASSSISQDQLDKVEDVARDYAYHHADSQKAGENFTYVGKDYQFAQKDQNLTITAQDGRDVILQMNTRTREIAVNKLTPEDSRQIAQLPAPTVVQPARSSAVSVPTQTLPPTRDAIARAVTVSALMVLDRKGSETKGGRFYSEGDYQISQHGDKKGPVQIIDGRNGNELLYAKADGIERENLGEDDIRNFTNLKAQMEQQRAGPSPPTPQQSQQEIGDLEY
jgi:hypothetical protein